MDTPGIEPGTARRCKGMLSGRDNQLHHVPVLVYVHLYSCKKKRTIVGSTLIPQGGAKQARLIRHVFLIPSADHSLLRLTVSFQFISLFLPNHIHPIAISTFILLFIHFILIFKHTDHSHHNIDMDPESPLSTASPTLIGGSTPLLGPLSVKLRDRFSLNKLNVEGKEAEKGLQGKGFVQPHHSNLPRRHVVRKPKVVRVKTQEELEEERVREEARKRRCWEEEVCLQEIGKGSGVWIAFSDSPSTSSSGTPTGSASSFEILKLSPSPSLPLSNPTKPSSSNEEDRATSTSGPGSPNVKTKTSAAPPSSSSTSAGSGTIPNSTSVGSIKGALPQAFHSKGVSKSQVCFTH